MRNTDTPTPRNPKPVCGRPARQCATPGCLNFQRKGHTLLRHEKLADGSRGHCLEPGCSCQTFTRRTCRAVVKTVGSACRAHGGKSPRGLAHPNFTHGRHSKYTSGLNIGRLMDQYQAALDNPDLLSLRDEIAVLDVLLPKALDQSLNGSTASFKHIRVAVDALLIATPGSAKQKATRKLLKLVDAAAASAAARDEFLKLAEQRRLLTASELRRETATLGMVPLSDVLSLITAVADVLKKHVSDIGERTRIFEALGELSGGRVKPPDGTTH